MAASQASALDHGFSAAVTAAEPCGPASNVGGWTKDRQFAEPLTGEIQLLPGISHILSPPSP